MGHSQADKVASRERVLQCASRVVRAEGVTRPGVAEMMCEAGLTHGGFYKHFKSREDLINQAADLALKLGSARMEEVASAADGSPRSDIVAEYLSTEHRDAPADGCALVTLGAATGRGGLPLKQSYERQVRAYLELLVDSGTDSGDETERASRIDATLALSAVVGAVLMSRAVADPSFSDQLLADVAEGLSNHGVTQATGATR